MATVAVFMGDSYTQGSGGRGARWTSDVARRMGWTEVNLGRGGTGYQTSVDNGTADCGLRTCPAYPDMISAAVAAAPAVVVVSGGRNDGSGYNPARIAAFYEALRAALPDATIYATDPLWDDDPTPDWIVRMGGDVRDAVIAVGGIYTDAGQPLLDHPGLISTDGVHPNPAGYRLLGAKIGDAIRG